MSWHLKSGPNCLQISSPAPSKIPLLFSLSRVHFTDEVSFKPHLFLLLKSFLFFKGLGVLTNV